MVPRAETSPEAAHSESALRPARGSLEDRTVPSSFYNLTTLASTGIPSPFAGLSFGNLPSINNQGRVAFVTNGTSGNGIYLAGGGQPLTTVTAAFTANNDSRSYGRGVAINNQNQILAMDKIGGNFFYIRQWDGNSPDQNTIVLKTPNPVPGSPDDTFDSVQTFTSINNAGNPRSSNSIGSQAARYV